MNKLLFFVITPATLVVGVAYFFLTHFATPLLENTLTTTPDSSHIIESSTVEELISLATTSEMKTKEVVVSELKNQQAATSSEKTVLFEQSVKPKLVVPKDWGSVSSELGFSLRYPNKEIGAMWGDDEYFQVSFIFPPSVLSVGASTTEKITEDIYNLRLYNGMTITVVEDKGGTPDLKAWAKDFLKKEDGGYGNKGTVLSETITAATLAGQQGYRFTRLFEGGENQQKIHYTKEEIFVRKGKFIYRFSYLSTSNDTKFPRSGLAGKEYLERVGSISQEVLETFVFDGSQATKISVTKDSSKQPTGEAGIRREKLLVALRTPPYFDESTSYKPVSSREKCDDGFSSKSNTSPAGSLHPFPGIYVGAGAVMVGEKNEDIIEIHAYDKMGNHTGPLPIIPWAGSVFGAPREERAQGITQTNLGSIGYGLVVHENMDARIEVVGKKFTLANFRITGNGNDCTIAEMLIPITPYSVTTLPMTVAGDLGPLSYDIDGDGKKDFELSLLHPLLPQKQAELDAVITDMGGRGIIPAIEPSL